MFKRILTFSDDHTNDTHRWSSIPEVEDGIDWLMFQNCFDVEVKRVKLLT